jgi:DNA-binding CsgD family transcriptional regulator
MSHTSSAVAATPPLPADRPVADLPQRDAIDPLPGHAADVLRRIAGRIEAGTAHGACAPAQGVLLDIVVGGVRCRLERHSPPELGPLSPREGQIARMVAEGRTNRAIATSLGISLWTVSTHLRRIFAKLGVGSRAEMVAHLYDQPGWSRS